MDVDALRESLLSRIGSDTTFKSLTGASASDPRLFYRYSDTVVVDTAHPVFVTYAMLPSRETSQGILEPIFQFNVWSQEAFYATMRSVRERVRALVDRQTWTVTSTRVRGRLINEQDVDLPNDGFVGRMLQFRLSALDL